MLESEKCDQVASQKKGKKKEIACKSDLAVGRGDSSSAEKRYCSGNDGETPVHNRKGDGDDVEVLVVKYSGALAVHNWL